MSKRIILRFFSRLHPSCFPLSRNVAITKPQSVVQQASMQSDTVLKKWSETMQMRDTTMIGPRFENADLNSQPVTKPAIQLVAEDPIVQVHCRKAVCDGGNLALGHPRVYINLDNHEANVCGYCGKRFQQAIGH